MKYFTFDWWRGVQGKGPHADPAAEYRSHLDRIRDRLSPDLLRIEEEISLHDGLLHELFLEVPAQRLHLVVEGDEWCHAPRAMRLVYEGVSVVRSIASSEDALSGPAGFGHLGYWEVDVLDAGYEHRFLFSSGIELHVVFSRFRLEIE